MAPEAPQQHPREPEEHRPRDPVGGEQLAGVDRNARQHTERQDRGRLALLFEPGKARERGPPAALAADHPQPGEVGCARRHHHDPGGREHQPLPERRGAGAEDQVPGGKRQHGRRAAVVVVAERQQRDQRQRDQIPRLAAAPPALVQVERGDHAAGHEREVARLAEVQQQLRRPGREQQAAQDQPRVPRQVLLQEQVEEPQREDPDQRVHDAGTGLVDPEHGHSRRVEHVGQRRQHVAQLRVQGAPVGAAHQVAPVPAGDVAALQQVAADQRGRRLVVPQGCVVQVHQAQVAGDGQHAQRQRRVRRRAHTARQAHAHRWSAARHGSRSTFTNDTRCRSKTPVPS